jgi:hypothetical protein
MSEEMSFRDGRAPLSVFPGREVDDRQPAESRRDGYWGRWTTSVCTTITVDGDPRSRLFTHEMTAQIAQARWNADERVRRGASR